MAENSQEGKDACAWCGDTCSLACSNCNKVFYCNRDHQKSHWQDHKDACRPWTQLESQDAGRYLVASRDLPAGSLILKENPLVLGPQANSPLICVECYSPIHTENFRRCGLCHWPMCESNCAASKRHLQECIILRRDIKKCGVPTGEGETPRYDLILIIRCLLLRLTNRSAWKKLRKMASHAQKRKEDGEPHHIAAVRYLKEVCKLENEDEIHHVRGAIVTNSINLKTPSGITLRGIYSTASLLNHSCTPNLTLRTNKNCTIFIHTTTEVKCGELLAFSYVSPCNPVWSRSSELYDIYYFSCSCKRCIDATEGGTFHSCPKCPDCPNQFLLHDGHHKSKWACSACGTQREIGEIMSDVETSRQSLTDMPNDTLLIREALEKVAQKYHQKHFLYLEAMQTALRNIRTATSNDLLQLKVELWEGILNAFSIVEPGSTRRRGVSLVEYAKCLLDLAVALAESDEDLKTRYLNQAELLAKEATGILSLEPPDSTEEHWLQITKQFQQKIEAELSKM